jgi:hypothetical protein
MWNFHGKTRLASKTLVRRINNILSLSMKVRIKTKLSGTVETEMKLKRPKMPIKS